MKNIFKVILQKNEYLKIEIKKNWIKKILEIIFKNEFLNLPNDFTIEILLFLLYISKFV